LVPGIFLHFSYLIKKVFLNIALLFIPPIASRKNDLENKGYLSELLPIISSQIYRNLLKVLYIDKLRA
jgi:hypothetical protein